MKKIKVSEATNLQLDWLVAKCEGKRVFYFGAGPSAYLAYIPKRSAYRVWRPSTNPAQMHPIIERIDGLLMKRWLESNREGKCQVEIHNYDGDWITFGPTLLIAAARCYVMSKLGEEVEVPEELT